MATTIHPGRYTATVDEPMAVFLIGMRVNSWWRVRRWWQVFTAMPPMLRALGEDPSLGLRHTEYFLGRTLLLVQYWESAEHLERFARDRSLPHAAAWADVVRELSGSGDVGIYHETYVVEPGSVETLYGDMPRVGLAAAVGHAPVGRGQETARQRLGRRGGPDVASAPPAG